MKMLLLLSCWIIAGVTAEDPPKSHYGVKNSSLCLQVGKYPPYQFATWTFNGKTLVANKNVKPVYKDKVHSSVNSSDHSLCINKLTETDSGIYKFFIIGLDFNESTEIHRLIVQVLSLIPALRFSPTFNGMNMICISCPYKCIYLFFAVTSDSLQSSLQIKITEIQIKYTAETVPTPVIKMSGLHSNLSAGLCNITVNCSIQNDWVWSVCDEDGCSTSQRSLFRKVNITIFTDSRSVVCRGNNQVSASNVSESIEAACLRKSSPENEETSEPPTVIVIITAVCVSFCAFAVCVARGLCSPENNHHQDQTPIAQLIQNQPVEAQSQSVQRASTSSSSQAEACYENVDATQPRQTSSPREELGPKQSQKVHTVYDLLQVPNVASSLSKNDSSKDMKGDKKIQEAPTSQYVILDEAERSAQIDTVYSVLQKPKI